MSGLLLAYSVFVLGNPPSPGLVDESVDESVDVELVDSVDDSDAGTPPDESEPLEERAIAYVISEGQALTTEGPMYMGPGIYMNHVARMALLEHVARQESLITGLSDALEKAIEIQHQDESTNGRLTLERNVLIGVGGALALTVIALLVFRK